MMADTAEGITQISWTVYGKIRSIAKANGTYISYTYDAIGNRISKTVTHADTTVTTWYVRDAQGNVLSIYAAGVDSLFSGDLTQTELHLYGSSRLGLWRTSNNVQNLAPVSDTLMPLLGTGYGVTFVRGNKLFELSNHLGNVLATVSDKKFGVSDDDSTVDYWAADVVSAQDYYPFGMVMVGRESGGNYRFGFNGYEKSLEINANKNVYTAIFWEYDGRIGRRWNVDPIKKDYESPYATFANSSTWIMDPNGADSITINSTNVSNLKNEIGERSLQSWMDLLNNKISEITLSELNNQKGLRSAYVQEIGSANNDPTNLDTYTLTITTLSGGINSPKELLDFIRRNFGAFMPSDVVFQTFNSEQRKKWDASNPVGSAMSFDKRFALWGFIGDDASVLTSTYYSDNNSAYWIFSTIATPWGDWQHPVSGTPQFGVTFNLTSQHCLNIPANKAHPALHSRPQFPH